MQGREWGLSLTPPAVLCSLGAVQGPGEVVHAAQLRCLTLVLSHTPCAPSGPRCYDADNLLFCKQLLFVCVLCLGQQIPTCEAG